MARTCKCQGCGNSKLTTDIAYRTRVGNVNKYYCNEQEYNSIQEEKEKRERLIIYIASEILGYEKGQIVPTVLQRKINELNKFYDYNVIEETFRRKKDDLLYWKDTKNFDNEYSMVSYLMAIVSSSINDVYKEWKFRQEQLQKENNNKIDIDIINTEIKTTKKKNDSIIDFLEEGDI